MKHTKLTLFMVACATIVSCNKNELVETPTQTPYTTQELTATDEMLSFNSQEEMYERAALLSEMNSEEVKAWYNSINSNFTSIEQIHQEAIREFEELSSVASGDFKTAEQIKDKYKKILLFNDNPQDEELYAPLMPISNSFDSYVCKKDGNIIVGGTVRNFKDITSYQETEYYKTLHQFKTKRIEETVNYVWIEDGKRRMWARAEKRSGSGAQWKKRIN